jgi:hypothetical protein
MLLFVSLLLDTQKKKKKRQLEARRTESLSAMMPTSTRLHQWGFSGFWEDAVAVFAIVIGSFLAVVAGTAIFSECGGPH